MSKNRSVATWSKTLATWVGIAGGLVSIAMAISAYRDANEQRTALAQKDLAARIEGEQRQADEHVRYAFDLVEKFHAAPYLAIRTDLVAGANYAARTCKAVQGGDSPLSTQEYFSIVEFFDRAQYCIEAGLCNRDVISQLLTPYADWWWPILKADILVSRAEEISLKTKRPFGFGLEALALEPATLPTPTCRQVEPGGAPHPPSPVGPPTR